MDNKFILLLLIVLAAVTIQPLPDVSGVPAVWDSPSAPLPDAPKINDDPLKILQPAILTQATNVSCSGQDILAYTSFLNDFSYSICGFFRQNRLVPIPLLKNIFYHLVNINAP